MGGQILLGQGMEWSIDPVLPKAEEPFTLTVRIPTQEQRLSGEEARFDVILPKENFLPPSLQVFKGPLIQTKRERAEGRLSSYLLITYVCVAPKAGRFRVDPISIRVGDREYRIEPFLVEVAQKDPPHRIPFELDWVVPNGPFYVGQAIPLRLVVKDLRVLKEPVAVQLEPTLYGILEKVTDLFREEPVKEQDGWVRSTIGQYLFTPYREGLQLLPSGTVKIETIEQKLNGIEIKVLPLPPKVGRSSGAVGFFSAHAALDESTISNGATTTLRIRIEGRGNLHWMKGPFIQVEHCGLIYTGRINRFRPSRWGYEGWIEETYRVVAEGTGSFTLKVQPFSFWDPVQQQILDLSFPPLSLRVTESQQEVATKNDAPKRVNLDLVSENTRVSGWTTWLYRFGSYALFLPVVFGLLGMRVWKKGRYVLYLVGWTLSIGALVLPFRGSQQTDPSTSQAINEYNKGVLYERNGQWHEALFHLRKSVYLSPDPVFRRGVQRVEEMYGPTFRVPLPRWVPDRWFLVGIGGLHLIALGSMVGNKKRQKGWILGVGISAVLIAIMGLYHSLNDLHKPWGVVVDSNVVLHRIPSAFSQKGIPVSLGSSFYVGTEKGDYVFVFIEGVKGWVEKKSLRRN
ncbi:MAG: BatD family protein [Spirochaetes bacterium]|nr:BatD family protein [Spirochaetota bacterium]